ncbi:MAG: 16S rRNA processing protein RimM [Clostridia bacterium]|jgi:16S rRNA processing protein RimM|nr:16S rRNA processing protein RimM [Clostridia bacterium]
MQYLTIAEVLKPQGIRGEIKIKTFTDFPEDVKAFKTVYIDEKPYKILSFRVGNDGAAFVGLAGVHDRDAAELLRGKLLKGNRADGPELEEGSYYIVDVIGSECVSTDGEFLGIVKDISLFSSDVYTIEKAGKSILFPAVKGVIVKVDVENKKVIINKSVFDEIAVF